MALSDGTGPPNWGKNRDFQPFLFA